MKQDSGTDQPTSMIQHQELTRTELQHRA